MEQRRGLAASRVVGAVAFVALVGVGLFVLRGELPRSGAGAAVEPLTTRAVPSAPRPTAELATPPREDPTALEGNESTEAAKASAAVRPAAAPESRAGQAAKNAPGIVFLVSSAGFDMYGVEVLLRDVAGAWQAATVWPGGKLLLDADLELPLTVTVPGHRPAAIGEAGGNIVVEPDCLLTLEFDQSQVKGLEPVWSGGLGSSLARDVIWTTLNDWWLLAVSGPTAADGQKLAFTLHERRHERLAVEFEARTGRRARARLANLMGRGPADLVVEAERPDGTPCSFVFAEAAFEPDVAETEILGGDSAPCGKAIWKMAAGSGATTIVGGRGAIRGLPSGMTLSVFLCDLESGAWAEVPVPHDGRELHVVLGGGGLELVGRLVVADGTLPSKFTASWAWSGRFGSRHVSLASPEPGAQLRRDVPVAEDGTFRLGIPDRREEHAEPRLAFTVDAEGFDPRTVELVDLAGPSIDAGTIELTPAVPEMLVDLAQWMSRGDLGGALVHFSGAGEIAYQVWRATRQQRGSILELDLAKENTGSGYWYLAWDLGEHRQTMGMPPQPLPARCAFSSPQLPLGVAYFERGPGDVWRSLAGETSLVLVQVGSLPHDGHWQLGLEWEGAEIPLEQVRSAPQTLVLRLAVPAGGARLVARPEHPSGPTGKICAEIRVADRRHDLVIP